MGLIAKFPDRFPETAFYLRKLGVGLYHVVFSCHSFAQSETGRNAGAGPVRRSHQSLAIFTSLH